MALTQLPQAGEPAQVLEVSVRHRGIRMIVVRDDPVGGFGCPELIRSFISTRASSGTGRSFVAGITSQAPAGIGYEWAGSAGPFLAAAVFAGLVYFFWTLSTKKEV